jgi:hypothetical protein
MAGKMVNVIAEKTEQLKKMNSKAIQVDSEEQRNKISEYIERGFNDVVDALMNSGQKVVDLRVTDLQGLYQDTDNDNTLKGFVTPRTLCFLRDATISAYFAFGKDGILSKNYHLLVEGLCGIGLSRKNGNGEVVVTEIAKEFENQMKLVVTEIDKMSNDKLPVYNQYFIDLVNQNRDKKGNPKLNHESITAAYNKIKEMLADKDVQGIERPIESQNLEPLITGAWAFMAEISSIQVDNTKNIEDYLSLEKLSSIITQWNSCAVLLSQLKSIIKNDKYGYTDKTKSDFSDTIEKIRKYSFAINIVDRYMKQHNPQAQSLLPALNTDFIDN